MSYSSRLRPTSTSARRGTTGNILQAARATATRLNQHGSATPKTNPLDAEGLKQAELAARMSFGRARRAGESGLGLMLPLIGWSLARLNRTRPMRAVNLFFFHYGTVMAAGVAYMLFFSVAAMLFAIFSIAGIVIGGNEQYQDLIVRSVNTVLPGVIGEGEGFLADPADLFSTSGLGLGLAVSLVLTVVTSLSWMHGLRSGIRSIWERPLMAENVVFVKARDLALMLVIGLTILITAALGVASTTFIEDIWAFLGWDDEGLARQLARAATLAISLVLDMVVAVLLMRVASRLVIPIGALWQSALIAGLGASLLRLASTTLLNNFAGTDNPLLAPFATVLGLFFYFYLFSLVYLMASAWGAVTAADRGKKAATKFGGSTHAKHS